GLAILVVLGGGLLVPGFLANLGRALLVAAFLARRLGRTFGRRRRRRARAFCRLLAGHLCSRLGRRERILRRSSRRRRRRLGLRVLCGRRSGCLLVLVTARSEQDQDARKDGHGDADGKNRAARAARRRF